MYTADDNSVPVVRDYSHFGYCLDKTGRKIFALISTSYIQTGVRGEWWVVRDSNLRPID
jgi:hypothetical protein